MKTLLQAAAPTCFKSATIIPVPKKTALMAITLTSIINKCFERLIVWDIKDQESTLWFIIQSSPTNGFKTPSNLYRDTGFPEKLPVHPWRLPHSQHQHHCQICWRCQRSRTDNSHETACREDVRHVRQVFSSVTWTWSLQKTKEMMVSFKKSKHTELSALCLNGEEVKSVESSEFLCVCIWTHLDHTRFPSAGEGIIPLLLCEQWHLRFILCYSVLFFNLTDLTVFSMDKMYGYFCFSWENLKPHMAPFQGKVYFDAILR